VSHVRVLAADTPLPRLLSAAAIALGAALLAGAGNASAQGDATPSIDGTWSVDTSITGFESDLSSGSWVGFRVAEVLDPGGSTAAVGRTPSVTGTLEAAGSVIERAVIEADLTGIISDRRQREPAIQRALGTSDYPTARFETSGPVDLGSVPVDGEPFSVDLPGTLTIRDVTQDVSIALRGQRAGDLVVVVGTMPIDFTSYDVTMPSAPIVVSVEGSGDLEWQLYFSHATDQATADASAGPEAEASAAVSEG